MNIVYYCYGGAHSSVLAAGIHLGLLPLDKVPDAADIESLPRYDKAKPSEIGNIYYMGKDEYNNCVYTIGMGSHRELIKQAVISLLEVSGANTSDLLLISSLDNINLKTRIGGFSSRRLGLVGFGRPLTIKGLQEKYRCFCDLVKGVKEREKNGSRKA